MSQSRWLCSDHHFYHDNILKFQSEQRPFVDVSEMHEVIIERHNSLVKPRDIVYFGGDVVLGGHKNLPIVARLNGDKRLIGGNHDNLRSYIGEYQKYFTQVEAVREFGHGFVIMSHYPVHPSQLETRYRACVHGHTHSNYILNADGTRDMRYVNITLDANDLYPTSWEDITTHIQLHTEKRK